MQMLVDSKLFYSKKIVRIDVGDTVFWKSTKNQRIIKSGKTCHLEVVSLVTSLKHQNNQD